jgi:hypothetical protein
MIKDRVSCICINNLYNAVGCQNGNLYLFTPKGISLDYIAIIHITNDHQVFQK